MWFSSSPIAAGAARQSEFAELYALWVQAGCSTRAASAIARAGCRTVQHIAAHGREAFLAMANTGPKTVDEIARVCDGFATDCLTPQTALERTLSMTIADAEEAAEIAKDCINSLIRAGFCIAARRAA